MSRRVLLLDITAMAGDAVCVAGIDLKSGQQIRLNEPQPTRGMISRWNLGPGDVIRVDVRPLRPSRPPHAEDCKWNPRSLRKEGAMPFPDMVDLVRRTAYTSIHDAFGAATATGTRRSHGWEAGKGRRSLATLAVRSIRAERDSSGKIRFALRDQSGAMFDAIPFQDLLVRRHAVSCVDCRGDHLRQIQAEFDADDAIVRVGLTRPFQARDDDVPVCWLQITNILSRPRAHFQDTALMPAVEEDIASAAEAGFLDRVRSAVQRLYGTDIRRSRWS